MSTIATLHSTDENRISSDPVSRTCSPGRKMTRAPKKPRKIAVQRRQRNTSPRNSALNRAANSGAVNDSAVARAIGVIDSPTKNASMENAFRQALNTCSLSFSV